MELLVPSGFRIGKPDGQMTLDALGLLNPLHLAQFYKRGSGPWSNNGIGVVGVMKTQLQQLRRRPGIEMTGDALLVQHFPFKRSLILPLFLDLEFIQSTFDFGVDGGAGLRDVFGWNHTIWDHLFKDQLFEQGTTMYPGLLRPKSRGSVVLSGPSINDPPIIDTNFLDHPDDIRTLVEGMKFLKDLEGTDEFKRHDMKLRADYLLCGDKHQLFSDDYFECYVREYVSTIYHPVSTCRMGPEGQNSVVDHRLRVHGMKKLRVMDASIMPKLVGANTNAACVMIGEKGASMILDDLRKRTI